MTRLNLVLILFACVLGLFQHSAKAELRVELLQVLLRHGERTPRGKEMWPNDAYDESTYEPWGLGQLINKGKMTEYRIGKMLRKRYDKFLGDAYHPSEVYAHSTALDRTKASLQLVLAALYPPNLNQTWNDALPWMPIPIHYIPEQVDHLMKPDFSPVYLEALQKARESEEILEKVSKFKDFFTFLCEKTGANITNTKQAYEIYNLLVAQKSMNLALPEWVTNEVYKKMQSIVKLEYEIRSYTAQMRRLNGGPLIKKFIDNVKLNEERARPRKIYLYSGHETNIAGFVRAHNFTEPELPNYGTAIILEKLSNEAGKPFVRMLLWSGVTEKLTTYKFNNCDEVCSFEKYKKIVNDAVPSEEEMYHIWDHVSKEDLHKLYEENASVD